MWGLNMKGFSALTKTLNSLENQMASGEIAKKMIDGTLPTLKKEIYYNLLENLVSTEAMAKWYHKWYEKRTGKLLKSITMKPAEFYNTGGKGKAGRSVRGYITFKGNQKDGERNGAVAAYLEYGWDNKQTKTHINPRPFVRPAVKDVAPECQKIMEKIFAEEIEKL